jgi:hypothetical protein
VVQSTTPQALELINGELLTRWLALGARRMLGVLPPEPASLFARSVGGRTATSRPFDVDISNVAKLWLLVVESGSNAPERVQPVWLQARLTGPDGDVPLSSLPPCRARRCRRAHRSGLSMPLSSASSGPLSVGHRPVMNVALP